MWAVTTASFLPDLTPHYPIMPKRDRVPVPPIYFKYHDLAEPFASDTGYLLTFVSQMAYMAFDKALEPMDIDARHYGVMTLVAQGDHRSQIAISENLGFDRTHVVRLVDNLEALGYVVRQRDRDDRRYYKLDLTEAGQAALKEAKERADRVQAETYSCLSSEERGVLNTLLRKLGEQQFSKNQDV